MRNRMLLASLLALLTMVVGTASASAYTYGPEGPFKTAVVPAKINVERYSGKYGLTIPCNMSIGGSVQAGSLSGELTFEGCTEAGYSATVKQSIYHRASLVVGPTTSNVANVYLEVTSTFCGTYNLTGSLPLVNTKNSAGEVTGFTQSATKGTLKASGTFLGGCAYLFTNGQPTTVEFPPLVLNHPLKVS